jgi:hypothetical protein
MGPASRFGICETKMFLPLDELDFATPGASPLRAIVSTRLADRSKLQTREREAISRIDVYLPGEFDAFLGLLLEDFHETPNTAEVSRALSENGWVSDKAFPVALVTELIARHGVRADTRKPNWREYTRRYGEAIIRASELP